MISVSSERRAATAARTLITISVGRDHLLALHVAAALRRDLVLDLHRVGAGGLELAPVSQTPASEP